MGKKAFGKSRTALFYARRLKAYCKEHDMCKGCIFTFRNKHNRFCRCKFYDTMEDDGKVRWPGEWEV